MTKLSNQTSFDLGQGMTLGEFRAATAQLPDEAVMSVHVTAKDRPWDSEQVTVTLSHVMDAPQTRPSRGYPGPPTLDDE